MRLATALPSRIAGTNVHCRAAMTAASSKSTPPDWSTSTLETCPSASTVTARTTSACLRSASAEGGYTASTCCMTAGGVTSVDDCADARGATAAEREVPSKALRAKRRPMNAGKRYNDVRTTSIANGNPIGHGHGDRLSTPDLLLRGARLGTSRAWVRQTLFGRPVGPKR